MLPRRTSLLALLVALYAVAGPQAQSPALPNRPDSLKFAAIGDNGTGDTPQYEVGAQMAKLHGSLPFDLVIMLGDNIRCASRRPIT
jgi:hypothetical protein